MGRESAKTAPTENLPPTSAGKFVLFPGQVLPDGPNLGPPTPRRALQIAPLLVRTCARDSPFVPRRPILPQVLSTLVAPRCGGPAGGHTSIGRARKRGGQDGRQKRPLHARLLSISAAFLRFSPLDLTPRSDSSDAGLVATRIEVRRYSCHVAREPRSSFEVVA